MSRQAGYEAFEASELYCPDCGSSRPVRSRLLLVLPTGNKFDYQCVDCGRSLGSRDDGDRSAFTETEQAVAKRSL